MAENTIELKITLLLPGVETEDDQCLARLETALQARKGIQRVHVEGEKRPVRLCLHYDPILISLANVQRLAERAGAQIVDRYRHVMIRIEGMGCSDCGTAVQHRGGRR